MIQPETVLQGCRAVLLKTVSEIQQMLPAEEVLPAQIHPPQVRLFPECARSLLPSFLRTK